METTDTKKISEALPILNIEIDELQSIYSNKKMELEDTFDEDSGIPYKKHFKTTFEIHYGVSNVGVPEYGLKPGVGLKRMRETRDAIKKYLKENPYIEEPKDSGKQLLAILKKPVAAPVAAPLT